MKHLKNLIVPLMYFLILGIAATGCKKDLSGFKPDNDENGVILSKTSFTDEEIEQIAQAHNDYLLDMINYGVHDRNTLIDYLQDNFDGLRAISRDSLNYLLDLQASFTKEDLLNLINDNAEQFNNAKALTDYLTAADQYLVDFDIDFLNNLESEARTELTGIDWQVFYVYISVMKKSKEFWIDMGYLDELGSNQPAAKVIQTDAESVAIALIGIIGGATILYICASTGNVWCIDLLTDLLESSGALALYMIAVEAAAASIMALRR